MLSTHRIIEYVTSLTTRTDPTTTYKRLQRRRRHQRRHPYQPRTIDRVRNVNVIVLGPVASEKEADPFTSSERSRIKRRDYYTQESWLRHRNRDRFVGTFLKIILLESGVARSLVQELILGKEGRKEGMSVRVMMIQQQQQKSCLLIHCQILL